MATSRPVLVLGATGSVGAALVETLLQTPALSPLVTLVRRPPERKSATGDGAVPRPWVVPVMDADTLYRATREALATLPGEVVALSVLGVGAGTANITLQAHRAVDVTLNEAFARGCRDAGNVVHLGLMSAVGANATASASGSGAPGLARYARVKGEGEAAVVRVGPRVVSIFRPALIVGSRHTPSWLARVAPALAWLLPDKVRPITTAQIARAMVATSVRVPAVSAVYHRREMLALGR